MAVGNKTIRDESAVDWMDGFLPVLSLRGYLTAFSFVFFLCHGQMSQLSVCFFSLPRPRTVIYLGTCVVMVVVPSRGSLPNYLPTDPETGYLT